MSNFNSMVVGLVIFTCALGLGVLLLSGCEDTSGDDLLGCVELSDGEVCVYCDSWGMIQFSREMEAIPYPFCRDFCNASDMGKGLEGCKEYPGSGNVGS